jgi:hypothetical protein
VHFSIPLFARFIYLILVLSVVVAKSVKRDCESFLFLLVRPPCFAAK